MEKPPEMLADFSDADGLVKKLALLVLTECHDPDFQVMQERVRDCFNRIEAEAFQLRLFEESGAGRAAL